MKTKAKIAQFFMENRRMGKSYIISTLLLLLLLSPITNAVMIGDFPGLTKLIDTADAIVILRIDRHLSGFGSRTFYSMHECTICHLKTGQLFNPSQVVLFCKKSTVPT